jgi:DNA repair exonuclease SbcCD ATPase subunit
MSSQNSYTNWGSFRECVARIEVELAGVKSNLSHLESLLSHPGIQVVPGCAQLVSQARDEFLAREIDMEAKLTEAKLNVEQEERRLREEENKTRVAEAMRVLEAQERAKLAKAAKAAKREDAKKLEEELKKQEEELKKRQEELEQLKKESKTVPPELRCQGKTASGEQCKFKKSHGDFCGKHIPK